MTAAKEEERKGNKIPDGPLGHYQQRERKIRKWESRLCVICLNVGSDGNER